MTTENPVTPNSPPPLVMAQSGVSRVLAWTLALLVIGYVFWSVNFSSAGRPSVMKTSALEIGVDAQFKIQARIAVGAETLQPGQDAAALMRNVDAAAKTSTEKVAAAIVSAELVDAAEAIRRLNALQKDADPSEAEDIRLLLRFYRAAQVDRPDAIAPLEREHLVKQLGWCGELALVQGKPDDDPERQRVLEPAHRAIIVSGLLGIVGLGGLFGGFVLLVIGLVLVSSGKLRHYYRPIVFASTNEPKRTVPAAFLEAFAIYLLLFVGLGVVAALIKARLHIPTIVLYALVCTALPIAMAWPVWRRTLSTRDNFRALGWHRGATRSAILEMLLGLVGYIACLPIIVVGGLITFIILYFTHTDASHPLVQMLNGSTWQIVGLFVLACVWAPISEETMFRGALYNHLRGRAKWWGSWIASSIIVGILFAAIHPQGWAAIPLLGSVGMSLAWIREWRGSLIGSMTAHAFNNATALTLALLVLR